MLMLAIGGGTAHAQETATPRPCVQTAGGCLSGAAQFTWNGTNWVAAGGTAATGGSAATPSFTSTTPGTRVLVPLTVATVTTGGTAVTALTAGQRSAGGWLYNPSTATVNLCINEVATASGTTTAGSLICIPPDRTYNLTSSANAVSVVTSDSAHAFGGLGYQ